MAAPVVHSSNANQSVPTADSVTITLTNAPPAGGLIVVLCAAFSGNSSGQAITCGATGGAGISITNRVDQVGTGSNVEGCLIWTVEYSSAPSALTITKGGSPTTAYLSAVAVNVTGQAASYFDVAGAGTGTSSSPSATDMANITDASDLVLGVMTRGTADSTTVSPATNWNQIVEIDEANATYLTLNAIYRAPGATGAYDPTWTLGGTPGSDTWWAAGIAIKGTAGTTYIPRMSLLGVG